MLQNYVKPEIDYLAHIIDEIKQRIFYRYYPTRCKNAPRSVHKSNNDRIVLKTNFHSNKASKDGLTGYCKECTAEMKYGKNRKSVPSYPKCPEDIDKDMYKWCSLCEKILLRNFFHNSNTSSDGLQNTCKDCKKKRRK